MYCKIKAIVRASGRHHIIRWNVGEPTLLQQTTHAVVLRRGACVVTHARTNAPRGAARHFSALVSAYGPCGGGDACGGIAPSISLLAPPGVLGSDGESHVCRAQHAEVFTRLLPGDSAAQERVKGAEPYRLHAQPGGKIQFKMAGIQVSPHAFPSVHTRQQPGRVMCASSSPPHPNKRPNVHIVAIPIRHKLYILHLLKPTVSLDVIAVVASSCGYSRGHIEPHAAQECTVHVATQRGRAKRLQHRHPPCVQPAAPMRECPCRRPRLPPEAWHR